MLPKVVKVPVVLLATILLLTFGVLPALAKGLPDHLSTLTPPDRRNGIISPSASVTIVTFEDYECEACAHTHKILKQLRSLYSGRVNFIFRHYPLVDQHPNALKAALTVEEAALQGKFMQKHDELLENQSKLPSLPEPTSPNNLGEKIKQDEADAKKLGVEGVPTTFVNGRNVGYVSDLDVIRKEIEKDILPVSIKFSPTTTGAKTGTLTLSGSTSSDKPAVDVTTKLPIKLTYESEGVTREQTIPNDPAAVCRDSSECSIPVPLDFTVTNTGGVDSGKVEVTLPGDPSTWKITAYDPGGQEIAILNGGVGSNDALWFKDWEEKFQKQEEENPFNLNNPQYIFFIIALILAILAWWKFKRR